MRDESLHLMRLKGFDENMKQKGRDTLEHREPTRSGPNRGSKSLRPSNSSV